MAWIDLNSPSQLDSEDFLACSLVFKHSTRCSVSAMAKRMFEREWFASDEVAHIPTYLLDLIAHRDISNHLATTFQVQHQSPQILLIKNGQCVYHASHGDIDAQLVLQFLSK